MKNYLKGFLKGSVLVLIYGLLLMFTDNLFPWDINDNIPLMLNIIFGLGISSYLVIKYKLPKVWALLSLVIGLLVIPFIMGSIEMKTKTLSQT